MNQGFYTIMAAQFCSSMADNALLIAAIALLSKMASPDWMTPLLKLFFVLSYVLSAAFVGTFADAFPKGKVMCITNIVKMVGCLMMIIHVHPLVAYAVVGFGAAAYSPAKYGILTELLPAEKLVVANGWVEGLTIISIILGTVLGGCLISPAIVFFIPQYPIAPIYKAITLISFLYLVSILINLKIPDTGVHYSHQEYRPGKLITNFSRRCKILWKDELMQISMAVTTLFWGAGASLQFIILKWAEKSLSMPLGKATLLQGSTAFGVAIGAGIAASVIPLKKSLTIMPIGVVMGLFVMAMTMVKSAMVAYPLLAVIGVLSGIFLVPMNALLQYRGHILMSSGHSIAVQNFNENLSVLMMLILYSLMIKINLNLNIVILLFGLSIAFFMLIIMRKHAINQLKYDSLSLLGKR